MPAPRRAQVRSKRRAPRGRRGACGTSFPDLLQDTDEISPEELLDSFSAVAPLQEAFDHVHELRALPEADQPQTAVLLALRDFGIEPRRRPVRLRLAVEPVGRERDVILADEVDRVVEMREV